MKKFGYVSVEHYVTIMQDFSEELEKGNIFATKCKNCGTTFFPPREECSNCYGTDMEKIMIDPVGTLVSYTIIHVPPESHANMAPYVVAIGEFNDGLRTMGHLVGVTSMDDLKVGRKIKIVPQTLENERIIYKFIPA